MKNWKMDSWMTGAAAALTERELSCSRVVDCLSLITRQV